MGDVHKIIKFFLLIIVKIVESDNMILLMEGIRCGNGSDRAALEVSLWLECLL